MALCVSVLQLCFANPYSPFLLDFPFEAIIWMQNWKKNTRNRWFDLYLNLFVHFYYILNCNILLRFFIFYLNFSFVLHRQLFLLLIFFFTINIIYFIIYMYYYATLWFSVFFFKFLLFSFSYTIIIVSNFHNFMRFVSNSFYFSDFFSSLHWFYYHNFTW